MSKNIPHVLITDDDVALRQTLRMTIEPLGARATEASDGEEALDLIQRLDVHFLLLDMHMPRMTGLETIREVQRVRPLVPWALMSSELDEELAAEARSLEALDVLPKPLSRAMIAETFRLAMLRFAG